MGAGSRRGTTALYVLAGVLFCGGALVLQSAQTGGVGTYGANDFPPVGQQPAAARSHSRDTSGAEPSRQMTALSSCAAGTGSIADRAFAFDGRVVAVHRHPQGDQVTFAVDTWFAGGHRSHVTVQMGADALRWTRTSELPPPHRRGAHLLVSGEPRWGGPPLRHPYAWGCGFTLPYSPHRAAVWRADFRGR